MSNNLNFTTWKEFLSTNESLQKIWKSLVIKKTEQKIFDIFTKHEYSFDYEWVKSENKYGMGRKKNYLDPSFRRAITEIKSMKKGRQYITEPTIQKMIKCIQGIQEVVNPTKVYSNPKNISSFELKPQILGNDKSTRNYKKEVYDNARIVDGEVYPPNTSDEYIEKREQEYWDDLRVSEKNKEEERKNYFKQLEGRGLIDKQGQTFLDL